uniref:Uncharacterized protein n=1 Tax=Lepeophtheirus salmonis TaxID=72036 RepID=A0A0K2V180_LEPSM
MSHRSIYLYMPTQRLIIFYYYYIIIYHYHIKSLGLKILSSPHPTSSLLFPL